MKCLVPLSLCALSLAKPQGKLVTETEGRIIGGEEAPKRKLRKLEKSSFQSKLSVKNLYWAHFLPTHAHSDVNYARSMQGGKRVLFQKYFLHQMSFPGKCLLKASGHTFVEALSWTRTRSLSQYYWILILFLLDNSFISRLSPPPTAARDS